MYALNKDALDLINRQQAEIAEANEKLQAQADTIFLYERVIKDKTAEIERLQKAVETMTLAQIEANSRYQDEKLSLLKDIKDRVDKRDEAIKEFAEKLKLYFEDEFIDNLVAEMTESPTKIEHSSLCETETYEVKE